MDYHSAFDFHHNMLSLLFINTAGTTLLLVIMLVLFALSFLIAGSKVAFFSLTAKDINLLKTRQQPSFRRIVALLEQPQTLLASMLIANMFVNIGIILISNLLINDWMKTYEMSLQIIFFVKIISVSLMIILFAEILPKIWAIHHKVWFASNASLIIEIFNSIFYRVSKKYVRWSNKIESGFSIHSFSGIDDRNLDEAIDLLPDHEASIEEKKILKGIRKFSGTTVKQIMRSRLDVSGIESSLSFIDIVELSEDLHYSRLPVFKTNLDEIIGILHIKDLLPYLDQSKTFDWHPLIRTPFFVHEQKLIEDLLQEFRARRIHFAIVVDEFGGTSGIVTMEDILEEVIGEIKDEFDDEESSNKKIDNNNYIFEGKTMIHDVCKAMDLPNNTFDLIRGDSDSLAGLVLEIAGDFPKINEPLVHDHFTFIPLEIKRNRIEKVRVTISTDFSKY